MQHIQKNALVAYKAEEMFHLVNDLERYPEFLPWCKQASLLKLEGLKHEKHQVEARLTLAMKGIEKSFTTRNPIEPNISIEMHLLDGPFKQLYGRWDFQALGDKGCKVSLEMQFEIKNPLLRATLGPIFTHIVNTLIEAFIQRAGDLYGSR